jgi:hypothetical protein
MARDITYKPDIKGTGKVMRGKAMEAFVRLKAQEGKQYAEAIAAGFSRTGEYASSFRVTSTHSGDRATAYLYNDSDHAFLVEYVDDYRTLGVVADILENGL